jgi:hypothetical protein
MPKKIKTTKKNKTPKTPKKAPAVKKTAKVSKRPVPVVAPPVAAPASPVPAHPLPLKTEAQAIWDEIKNLPIHMFGLPAQIVGQHCTPVPVEPTKLYVMSRSPAVLPSLETAIAPAFEVELADKFIIIKRAVKLPTAK